MSISLGRYPIALLIVALLIPLMYCLKWKKKEVKNIALLNVCGLMMVFFYPLTHSLSTKGGVVGYTIGKTIIFVLLPMLLVFYTEKWKIKDILFHAGIRKENMRKSIIYGLMAAGITIIITVLVSSASEPDIFWRVVMFFEAFTEEFFFRGILLLYLARKTNTRVAFLTSVVGFILIHPQHFGSKFVISTVAQAILLAIVVNKTENIMGAWLAHGLNRNIPSLIRIALGI